MPRVPTRSFDLTSEADTRKRAFAEANKKPRRITLKRRESEHEIQKALVQHLKLFAYPDVYWTAIPNGSKRTIGVARKLKAEGVRAGAPDILLIREGKALGLELKAAGGAQSPAQKATEELWWKAGGHYVVA